MIALTGASGYLGQAVKRLLAGRVVTVGRRDADVGVDLASAAPDWASHAPRTLVHGAGIMSSDARCLIEHARIGANVLTGLPASVEHLVLVSSAYVYPPSATPLSEDTPVAPSEAYGHAKVMVEALFRGFAKATSKKLTILRPCAIIGPQDPHRKAVTAFAAAAREGRKPTLSGNFREPRDYIHVDDAARAVVTAVDSGTEGTFNVCTGHAWSAADIVALIASFAPDFAVPVEAPLAQPVGYKFSPERATQALGFTARITMKDALSKLITE